MTTPNHQPTPPQPVDIARLRELLAKATPGPWGVERTDKDNWIGPMRRSGDGKVAEIVCDTDRNGLYPEYLQRNDANADLIAALRNAAPALLDELERLRKDSAELNAIAKAMGNRPVFDGFKTSPERLAALMHVAESRDPKGEFMKALAERDKLREEVERLSEKVSTIKRAAMEAVGECETWADVLSKGPAIRSERDSLRRDNAELKAKLK